MHKFKQKNSLRKINAAFTLVVGIGLVTPVLSPGQTSSGKALTLKDCISSALGQSPELEVARLESTAADEAIKSAQGGLFPFLKGTVSSELFSGSPLGPFALQNAIDPDEVGPVAPGQRKKQLNEVEFGQVWNAEASFVYPLFQNGSILGLNQAPAVAAEKAKKLALSWTRNLTREDIIYTVSEAYLTALSTSQKVQLDEKESKLAGQRLQIIKSQVSQGLKMEEDVRLAESQAQGSELAVLASRQQANAAIVHLAPFIGVSEAEQIQLDPTYPAPPKLPPAREFVEGALRDHPSIGAQKATIEEKRQEYLLARSQNWPTVNLEGSAGYGDDFDNSGNHLYQGKLIVEVPIFDFGQRGSAARASRDRYRAEELRMAVVTQNLRRTILDAYNAILVTDQSLLTREREIEQSKAALKRLQTEQESGKVAPLAAVEAEITLMEKQKLLHDERLKRLLQYATLQKLAGGSWQWLP